MAKDIIGRRLRVGINPQDSDSHVARFLDADRETFVSIDQYENGNNPVLALRRARGTVPAPAIVANGDILGEVEFFGYTNQWHHCAEMISTVWGAPALGVVPDSDIQFHTTELGGLNLRMRLLPDGKLLLGAAAFLSQAEIAANGIGRLWVGNTSDSNMFNFNLAGNNSNSPTGYWSKSRGTLPVPLTVQTGDEMMYMQGRAYTNQWHTNVGAISMLIDGAVTAGQRPGNRIMLRTGKPNDGGPTTRIDIRNNGNIAFNNNGLDPFGASSEGVIAVGNRNVAPTANPSGGGVLYAESGAGKWRGSGGTITTFGPADPHCPDCGSDYGWEFERPADVEPDPNRRYLAVCLRCLVDVIDVLRPGPKGFIRRQKPNMPEAPAAPAAPIVERPIDPPEPPQPRERV